MIVCMPLNGVVASMEVGSGFAQWGGDMWGRVALVGLVGVGRFLLGLWCGNSVLSRPVRPDRDQVLDIRMGEELNNNLRELMTWFKDYAESPEGQAAMAPDADTVFKTEHLEILYGYDLEAKVELLEFLRDWRNRVSPHPHERVKP